MKQPKPEYPSRKLDQFVIRLPDGMREQLAETAKQNNRSMNSEIVARLENFLREKQTVDLGTNLSPRSEMTRGTLVELLSMV